MRKGGAVPVKTGKERVKKLRHALKEERRLFQQRIRLIGKRCSQQREQSAEQEQQHQRQKQRGKAAAKAQMNTQIRNDRLHRRGDAEREQERQHPPKQIAENEIKKSGGGSGGEKIEQKIFAAFFKQSPTLLSKMTCNARHSVISFQNKDK